MRWYENQMPNQENKGNDPILPMATMHLNGFISSAFGEWGEMSE